MTEADVFSDRVIVPKNIWGTPGTHQHYTQFSCETEALYFLFGTAKRFVAVSWTGGYDTANETNYVYIQETFVETRLSVSS